MKKASIILLALLLIALTFSVSTSFADETETISESSSTYYLHENSNVDTIHATTVGAMPCIGEARIIVFYVDFLNGSPNWTKTVEEVNDMFFSETAKNDSSLAYSESDSLRSYYYRSSYGKVDITGTVYEYQTAHDTSYYTDANMALGEVIEYYRNIINWDDYDGNNDGYIDGIYLIARNSHSFSSAAGFVDFNYSSIVSQKGVEKYCFLVSDTLLTLLHETCHMFGPPDMYQGVNVNPEGLETHSFMNGGLFGDLPSPTKFALGWLDNVKFIDVDSVGTYELRSYDSHADVLVIYPNGDKTNRNWFFVEYVPAEGNNPEGGNGLRVWKTQMYLDEDYNVIGEDEWAGSGALPSPYEYLESVHLVDSAWNYYLKEGESITPYTYPSTAYSDTFYFKLGGRKYLKDLTFSGISIDCLSVKDGVASVSVTIAEEPNFDTSITLESAILTPDNSSIFLGSVEKCTLATISSPIELFVQGDCKLISVDGNNTVPLTYEINDDKNCISIYLDTAFLTQDNIAEYVIYLPNISTYYGQDLTTLVQIENLDLSKIPIPYQLVSDTYTTNFSMTWEFDLKWFRLSDDSILTIYLDNTANRLYWGEFDLTTNTTTAYELEIPVGMIVSGTNDNLSVWKDGEYYYTYLDGFICCYQNRELVNYLDTTPVFEMLSFCGTNNNSYFIDNTSLCIYKMENDDDEITFEPVASINEHPQQSDILQIRHGLLNGVGICLPVLYCLENGKFLTYNTYNDLCFIDETNVLFPDYDNHASWRAMSIKLIDDKIYVFNGGQDLIMTVYDYSFNKLSERVLLKGLGDATYGPMTLSVEYIDNIWVISFRGEYRPMVSFQCTFVTTFDMNGNILNYYKSGDNSRYYVCHVVPLSKESFVCINAFRFFYIGMKCDVDAHIWDAGITSAVPTCENEGAKEYACTVCHETRIETIPALGHDEISHDAQAPTCTEIGWNAYVTCSRCDYKTYQEIPATGHSHNAVVIEPTCTAQGYTTYTCHCGDSHIDNYVEALGHTAGDAVVENNVAPNCTEDGHYDIVVYCTVCGVETSRDIVTVSALGHAEGEWIVDIEPTCTQDGSKYQVCATCGATINTESIDALGHTEGSVVVENDVAPNCTEDGSYDNVVYCTVCETELSRNTVVVPALGHTEGEWITDSNPTCTQVGSKHQVCPTCGETIKTTSIDATGHTEGSVVVENNVAPNCTEDGSYDNVTYCKVCDDELSRDTIVVSATGHTEGAVVVENNVAPNCIDDGSYDNVVYCTVCDVELSRDTVVVDALGHNSVSHDAKAPTCTEIGWDAYETCTRCDYTTYTEIAATGHSHNAVVTQPTCTTQGYTTHTCHCGDSYVDSDVDALGHTEVVDKAVVPTCTNTGLTEGKHCSVCNEVLVLQTVVPALGHTPSQVVVENNVTPNCTEDGRYDNVFYCTVCHAELSRNTVVVPAFGHSYSAVVTAPTCTEQGYTTYTCSRCDDNYKGNYVDAIGHIWNWVTDKEPTYTETGLKHEECSVCHVTQNENTVIPVKTHEHNYVSEATTAPTCTEKGVETFTCSICNDTYTRDIAPTGHTYNTVVTNPTCTEQGYTTYTCHCGDTYVADKVAATGHTQSPFVVENDIAATCTVDGSCDIVIYCAVCDAEVSRDTVVVPALGHRYNSVVTAPTCTAQGYTTHTCHCGDTYVDTYVPATDHNQEADDGDCTTAIKCSVCQTVVVEGNENHIFTDDKDTACNSVGCYHTRVVVDENAEQFKQDVAAIANATTKQQKMTAINTALASYALVEDKASVASEYNTLKAAIDEYNAQVEDVNQEYSNATDVATRVIASAVGIASALAGVWILLKKRILGGAA